MAGAVDLFMVYQFIKRLATPFEKWPAYERGIIDRHGKILKDKRERRGNIEDRKAFTKLDLLVLKIKSILESIPIANKKIGSYAAALWFIKEHQEKGVEVITEEDLMRYIVLAESTELNRDFEILLEEPTMSAGGGQVDGIGIGPKGEPGFTKSAMSKYKKKNKQLARFIDRWSE